MSNLKASLQGYLIFFITVAINSSLAVVIYSSIKDKEENFIAGILILYIFFSSILCATIDFIRRRLTVDKPVREILEATKKMTYGNFDIQLEPSHKRNYTSYDLIKLDLNRLALELSKIEMLKSDFISNVSHEIKTPLTIIQNYAQALEDKYLPEKERRTYLESLQGACKRLTNLVTDILKLNKLENGELFPQLKRFNVSESLTEQILEFIPLIEAKDIQLECSVEPDIFIHSEQSYLELVWSNLISNAIKFTENEGTIRIQLKSLYEKLIFTIEDTGCGMQEETGKRIFDKFYQGDTSHSKEGNGLGLALVKRVIDILGGEITVESELGKGTKFQVSIREDGYGR